MYKKAKVLITQMMIVVFGMSSILPAYAAGLGGVVESESLEVVVSDPKALEDPVEQSVDAVSTTENLKNTYYAGLMRDVRKIKEGERNFKLQNEVLENLDIFIESEKKRLDDLGVEQSRQEEYFHILDLQKASIDPRVDVALERIWEIFDTDGVRAVYEEELEIRIPEKPAGFRANDEEVILRSMENPLITLQRGQTIAAALKDLVEISTAYALADEVLPTLEDVSADDAEVIINSEISNLARELNNNPVEIFNFVKNNIDFEPYYGAKKGSVGCLREGVCNDVDTASLTIALMRAAGIPARYKKSVAVMSVEQLQQLLGVEETKTVFFAFIANKVPIYTISGNITGTNFDTADFSQETHLALEWTHVEVFYDYDERGANIPNTLAFEDAVDTMEVRAKLAEEYKKQWISVDAAMKTYDRVENEIVADTAAFDTEAFWYGFLQYQGDLSPLEKYAADLQAQTGKDINNELYRSTKTIAQQDFEILPSTLPYWLGEGQDSDGNLIEIESWSVLPDVRRSTVKVSLLRELDGAEVLAHEFYGSEINNQGMNLYYRGATEADETVIESYGGIHTTPASLVDITPYFVAVDGETTTAETVAVGDALLLQFEYFVAGELIYEDQKFSVAGNDEGVYVVLSKVVEDPLLDDKENPDRNSFILLEGNVALGRAYLKEVEDQSKFLQETLDHRFNMTFSRAVVTQNRVLAEVGGVPTSFDFSGLTMDAAAYINDYSNRGNYKDHWEDFRLLWGLSASDYEAGLFMEVPGLDAISTITGLQYAYANPGTYTVHVIDSGNESVIDTLSLSANTKANMHADVQDGNTVVTPDKLVEQSDFRGVLYVSLDDSWTGTYAIGEQVANGAWSTEEMQVSSYQIPDHTTLFIEYYSPVTPLYAGQNYIYQNSYVYESIQDGEKDYVHNIACRITDADYASIGNDPGYNTNDHGVPCFKPNAFTEFGDYHYVYRLTTNGIKFFEDSPSSFSYWTTHQEIKDKVEDYIANKKNLPTSALTYLESGDFYDAFIWKNAADRKKYKFSLILGTYMFSICETDGLVNCGDYAMIYYLPTAGGGEIYRARADIWSKLGDSNNAAIKKMGVPISDELYSSSSSGKTGVKQEFMNGTVYNYETYVILSNTYYSHGSIFEAYDNFGGPSGTLGFPIEDPKDSIGASLYQAFESEQEIHLKTDGQADIVSFRYYRCQTYGDVVAGDIRLPLYFAHGVINGLGEVIEGAFVDLPLMIWGVVQTAFKALFNPIDTYKETQQILEELGDLMDEVTWGQVWNAIQDEADQTLISVKEEIETSTCEAREKYLIGYLIGSSLAISKVIKGIKWGNNFVGNLRIGLAKLIKKVDKFDFRNSELLNAHFSKHGAELGATNLNDYLNKSNKFLNDKSDDILIKIRESNKDVIKYSPTTNEFAVLSRDGYIRTYFKPIDGIDYFNEQK